LVRLAILSCLLTLRLPRSTLFPYTTLFRSDMWLTLGIRPLSGTRARGCRGGSLPALTETETAGRLVPTRPVGQLPFLRRRGQREDRKSTRLNSSHVKISYAVFCLKKKKNAN